MGKIHQALEKRRVHEPTLVAELSTSGSDPAADLSPEGESPGQYPLPRAESPTSLNSKDAIQPLSSWDERLRIAIEPSSAIAESFRKLRTKLLHPGDGQPPRTVLITSSVPMEGKGFVTANLGTAIANSMEQSCLLVDCDLRRPTLASLFGMDNQSGISSYLKGEISNWPEIIRPTALEKLSLITSGPSPPNPAELIDSERMRHFFAALSTNADRLVIVDSPPFQAAAETAILAELVDKVIVVVRWGKPGREQVKNLVEAIGKEKIIGIVFNAFELNALDASLQKRGYYGYYGYYGKGY